MKIVLCSVVGLLLSALVIDSARSQARTAVAADPSLRAFLPQFEEGINRFINGDPALWKQNASQRDDATIMGAWGAYEVGWDQASPRYDWAAARFKPSGAKAKIETLASGVSGDLAYTVSIERSEVRVIGQEEPASMPLRVTHIFRKEDGVWKLLHRHADPLMGKIPPAAVLQK